MSSQLILKNFKQSEFGNTSGLFNHSSNNKYFIDALKYYGYNGVQNKVIYPMPVIRHSKTLTKQASLLSLPVQPLNKSLEKYLTAVKPLVNEAEFQQTSQIVQQFQQPGGLGEKLQKLLQEKAKKTDNWLAQWWTDKVYLEPRYGLPINVNPNLLFPKANYKSLNEQLEFATNYACGTIEYKRMIDSQQLPVEKLGASPLCMDQYYKIFSSCRVPKLNKDLLKVQPPFSPASKHITVMYKNRIFALQVIENDNETSISKEDILSNLKQIVETTKISNDYNPSIFTAENRDAWALVYEALSKDETNRQNFESIENSMFVLCLDEDVSLQQTTDERSMSAAQLLHGNKVFSQNRWFDKTIQVVVGANGVYGLNFEHTVAEGVPFANLGDFVADYMTKTNQPIAVKNIQAKRYRELVFNVPTEVRAKVDTTKVEFFKRIDDLDLYIHQFDSFGKNFPKSQKVSPDAFVQIALQLAFFKLHKKWASAYESGSLRKFTLGRTEIIRSCTDATAKFIKSTSENKPNAEKAMLLRNAIAAHSAYSSYVLNFESFDRHLMGLKLTALENNLELPELYKDSSFVKLCSYQISSSQISSKQPAVVSFGPAVIDGYGICYNIMETRFIFGLSAFNSCKETSTKLYANSISDSLLECQAILANSVTAKL